MRAWRVLDRGRVPERGERLFAYRCDACGEHGLLPVLGEPLVQQGSWVIFTTEEQAVPAAIECAHCKACFGLEPGIEPARRPPQTPQRRRDRAARPRHLRAVEAGRAY